MAAARGHDAARRINEGQDGGVMKGGIPEENGYKTGQQQLDLKFAGPHYARDGSNKQGIILKGLPGCTAFRNEAKRRPAAYSFFSAS